MVLDASVTASTSSQKKKKKKEKNEPPFLFFHMVNNFIPVVLYSMWVVLSQVGRQKPLFYKEKFLLPENQTGIWCFFYNAFKELASYLLMFSIADTIKVWILSDEGQEKGKKFASFGFLSQDVTWYCLQLGRVHPAPFF